jgi:hypothetical protein
MIVGTTPMIAIPGAAFMHPVAMIVGTAPQNCCNDFGYGCPMIAIPAADDCGSLQLSMTLTGHSVRSGSMAGHGPILLKNGVADAV